jgi:hypothetical protein
MNQQQAARRQKKFWKMVLKLQSVKTKLSQAQISEESFLGAISQYRFEEQVMLLYFYYPLLGSLSKYMSFWGALVFIASRSTLIFFPTDWSYEVHSFLEGLSVFSFFTVLIFSLIVQNKRGRVRNGFEEIALDYLRYTSTGGRNLEPPSRYIADANDAELAAAEFMRWLGFLDAEATPIGPDGGIDIAASNAVGQVKDYGKPIGSPDIQQHLGVAIGEGGKLPIFFARSGYTTNALEFADENEMPLFQFDLAGSWKTSNLHAERLWNAGADIFLENRKETTEEGSGFFSEFEEPGVQYEYYFSNESDESLEGFDDLHLEDLESDFTDPPKSLASELQEIAALRDMGVLSEEEFLKAKKKLLD